MNGTESKMVIQPTNSCRMYLGVGVVQVNEGHSNEIRGRKSEEEGDARVRNLQLLLQKRNEFVDCEVVAFGDDFFQQTVQQLLTRAEIQEFTTPTQEQDRRVANILSQ